MWTDLMIIPAAESWVYHLFSQHIGAVVFLLVDIICLSLGLVLTVSQASQVIIP